ncbi:hypothetical protein GALMADRAFT_213534 [Galerina marginata CBS 339.88]|uniref:Uncharacterized protein n=1 Tax=Galerina marginata (strain CBS 339.88) TaxID=685588 RepID=A0A067SMD8_GALM3|nr:hypothetical protein GALMADRAFT_213534 [Galerina marginata CBS 339.88]
MLQAIHYVSAPGAATPLIAPKAPTGNTLGSGLSRLWRSQVPTSSPQQSDVKPTPTGFSEKTPNLEGSTPQIERHDSQDCFINELKHLEDGGPADEAKFYAVLVGRQPGVFYGSFDTEQEAITTFRAALLARKVQRVTLFKAERILDDSDNPTIPGVQDIAGSTVNPGKHWAVLVGRTPGVFNQLILHAIAGVLLLSQELWMLLPPTCAGLGWRMKSVLGQTEVQEVTPSTQFMVSNKEAEELKVKYKREYYYRNIQQEREKARLRAQRQKAQPVSEEVTLARQTAHREAQARYRQKNRMKLKNASWQYRFNNSGIGVNQSIFHKYLSLFKIHMRGHRGIERRAYGGRSEGTTCADDGPASIPGMESRPQDAELMGGLDLNGDGSEGATATRDGLSSEGVGFLVQIGVGKMQCIMRERAVALPSRLLRLAACCEGREKKKVSTWV